MSFLHPEFLYLMLPALAILFFFLISGEEEHHHHFSKEVLEKLQVHSNTLTMKARNALFFIMFALIIIALAQPVIEDGKVKIKAKSSDIMIALDISDSMLAQDVYPTRLEAAKKKILDLLKASPQERIGVMAFAKDAYLVSPLSFDHRAVRFLLKQLNTDSITEKGTDFIRLLSSAKGALKEDDNRYLLILTDGADKEDFSKEIALAKEEGIRIFILAVATRQGAPIKLKDGSFIKQNGNIIVSKLNSAIKELALQTGGAYVESVTSSDDIKAMLKEIQAKTQKRELKEEEVTLYIALFYYPLALAMFLLIIATSSMSRREKLMMPHVLVFILMGLHVSDAQAGLLDFRVLDEAKSSYENGDYNRSSKLYSEYIQTHDNAQSHYNRANADYKKGNYKAAATGYEQIQSEDKDLQFNALHNLGNSYAKQGDPESLKKAIESYEKALKIKDETPTRENLEAVKKAIEEQKQKEQEQKNDKECDNPKEGDEGDKQKDQKKDQDSKDKKEKSQEQQDKEQQEQENREQDQKDQDKKDAQKQKEQEQKEQEKQEAAQKSEEEKKQDEQNAAAMQEDPNKMSEREAQKWLKMLNDKPIGHLYQLNKEQSQQERDKNEKPW
ncbi:MAG: VWA domain-containing protein [Campylobacterota bacterium]|nr:VWA domain-containing protein [Campylobacterota bacterium]